MADVQRAAHGRRRACRWSRRSRAAGCGRRRRCRCRPTPGTTCPPGPPAPVAPVRRRHACRCSVSSDRPPGPGCWGSQSCASLLTGLRPAKTSIDPACGGPSVRPWNDDDLTLEFFDDPAALPRRGRRRCSRREPVLGSVIAEREPADRPRAGGRPGLVGRGRRAVRAVVGRGPGRVRRGRSAPRCGRRRSSPTRPSRCRCPTPPPCARRRAPRARRAPRRRQRRPAGRRGAGPVDGRAGRRERSSPTRRPALWEATSVDVPPAPEGRLRQATEDDADAGARVVHGVPRRGRRAGRPRAGPGVGRAQHARQRAGAHPRGRRVAVGAARRHGRPPDRLRAAVLRRRPDRSGLHAQGVPRPRHRVVRRRAS